jgi:hypothetical protein
MKNSVKDFVAAYLVCSQAKPDRARYPGLLSPLSVPTEAWQMISMDFIEGILVSGNANCIMVVVDRFSKFAHFVPLRHPYNAEKVAQVFLDQVFRLHGLPTHIVSDCDPVVDIVFSTCQDDQEGLISRGNIDVAVIRSCRWIVILVSQP